MAETLYWPDKYDPLGQTTAREKYERSHARYCLAQLRALKASGVEGADRLYEKARKEFGQAEWEAAEFEVDSDLSMLKDLCKIER